MKSKNPLKSLVTLLFAFVLLSNFAFAQPEQQEQYSKVRIHAKTATDYQRLSFSGLIFDGGMGKPGEYFETWISTTEMHQLQYSGIPYDILIPDWKTYYESLPTMSSADFQAALLKSKLEFNVSHNIMGSMGGMLTYDQVVAKLDSMRLEYPNLISIKWSIGTTYENRNIWCVRMSNNPNAPTGRPEVFLDAVTHAREGGGMECLIYYMYWLLENYNIDPLATYILNNRELYIIPIFNVDGYYYNQTTYPSGGGMWRKNRKPCSGSTGTDLNRNNGIYQYWNSSNGGSSTSCSSDTYRGTSPNSEPETQAYVNFLASRNFKTAISYHTYGNDLIRPWAWCDPIGTPDSNIFKEWQVDMTKDNHYSYGTCYSLLGYFSRGDALDQLYNDSAHAKILGMTPEVGSDFWPPQSEILPNAQKNLWMCQYMSMTAGAFVNPVSSNLNKDVYSSGEAGTLKVVFRNKGLANAQNIKVEWTPLNSYYVTIPTTLYTKPSMASMTSDSVTFNFTVSSAVQNNYAIPTRLKIKQEDTNTVLDKIIYIKVGSGNIIFADSAENGLNNWTVNTTNGWGIVTSSYHSPTHSFTDSPSGNYPNSTDNPMTLTYALNTASSPMVNLSFWHKYITEASYDFCYVEVSNDNGTTWNTVASYDGTLSTWTYVSLDISQYTNSSSQVKIRFRLNSDQSLNYDGWYVDDIKLLAYQQTPLSVGNEGETPLTYKLSQNYPNPFNPVTLISFAIPKTGFVSLKVYDLLGKEVSSLVNETKTAGSYNVMFDASKLSSGIYFYKLETSSFTDTKKMVIIK